MKTIHFPFLALPLGLVILLIVSMGQQGSADDASRLPLLTMLVMTEFAFFATGFAAYIGFKHMHLTGLKLMYGVITLLCALLSIRFMLLGIALWPL